jgi:hypothetical protein
VPLSERLTGSDAVQISSDGSVWWFLARSVMLFAGAEEQKACLRCSAVSRRLGGCLEAAGEPGIARRKKAAGADSATEVAGEL